MAGDVRGGGRRGGVARCPGPWRRRRRARAEQEGDAEGGHPQSPAGAAEQAGEVPDREAGHGGSEDVALVEQVEGADGEPGDAEPAGQGPGAHDDDADGDRPADDEELAQVFAEQRAAELVLRGPGGLYRSLGGGVPR